MTPGQRLAQLMALGSAALSAEPVAGLPDTKLGQELRDVLTQRNGFVAFESSLVVRGTGTAAGGLTAWNAPHGWRSSFADLAEGIFFFAEDVFGGQFGLDGASVVSFDPETGQRDPMATSLEGWAAQVLDNFELLTGHPLARAWQREFGPLPLRERLVPKVPFVLGGEYELANLHALDDETGMRVRGELAVQIRDLPDGAQVHYQAGD